MKRSGALAALCSALVVACLPGDRSKPVGIAPLALPSTATVQVRHEFSTEPLEWEIGAGRWAPREDSEGNGVFAQTATEEAFPVAVLREPILADVDVRVRFRPLSGRVDASGGLVFRAQDAQNYYLVRGNALENNFRLYRIVQGRREQLASTRIEPPALGAWHTLRVVAIGDQIQAYLNDELLLDERDATFARGRVGLWTKADSVTEFDELAVQGAAAAAAAGR